MSYYVVGSCPKCGAPIYAPSVWHGTLPPPSHHTCGCHQQREVITTENTLNIVISKKEDDGSTTE